jgi:DNA repair exonuclease SbcCD ATPase subunit
MNILKLVLRNIMRHRDTTLELPEKGVIVVTGPNGGGKSSIIEGVSVALWGDTLRGTPAWREEPGEVHLVTDLGWANRTRKGTKTGLHWAPGRGEESEEYETATKAQAALEGHFGAFSVWRRTHVFSSSDAAHFTMATDGERKRLLETILHLDRFDVALEACRKDLKSAALASGTASMQLQVEQARVEGAKQRALDAEHALLDLPPEVDVGALEAEYTRFSALSNAANADIATRRAGLRADDRTGYELLAAAQQNEAHLARIQAANCPTCEQPIPAELRDQLRVTAAGLRARAEGAQEAQRKRLAAAEVELEELTEEADAIVRKRQKVGESLRSARDSKAARASAVARRDKAVKELEGAAEALEARRSAQEATQRALGELEAVDLVLGLKGVRAHVLGKSLAGIEQVANAWLARIAGPGLSLSLKPYSEKKSGGVSDAISLEITGAGYGYGYRGASGGERRRLDVALLLALAEVAQAAYGQAPGTLFFDEVFDALDKEGEAAVLEVIKSLGEERAVVVITHSPSLAERLPAVLRLRVADGAVS